MKNSIIIAIIGIAILCSSCGTTTASTTSNTTTSSTASSDAYNAGSAIGSSLKVLYTQYKKNGTINLKSPSTILTLSSLASHFQSIKSSLSNKSTYGQIASGIIAGSQKSVTSSTVDNVINALGGSNLTNLISQVKDADTSTPQGEKTVNSATSTITNILKFLK